MPTLKAGDAHGRSLHILEADGAVLLQLTSHTFVIFLVRKWEAAFARVTVERLILAANAADTALIAVKHFLLSGLVIEEIANFTKV